MVDVLLSLGMFEVASSPCCGVWGSHQAGAIVVAGLISPYAADRDYAREVAAAAAAVCEEGKGWSWWRGKNWWMFGDLWWFYGIDSSKF